MASDLVSIGGLLVLVMILATVVGGALCAICDRQWLGLDDEDLT